MSKIPPKYLSSYLAKRCDDRLYKTFNPDPVSDLDIIVVIPAYKEKYATILKTIESLEETSHTGISIAVLILVNYKDTDPAEIKEASQILHDQLTSYRTDLQLYTFISELTGKHKGVGLARKILMDTALLWFNQNEVEGLIVNLDADTTVAENYFTSITAYFDSHLEMEAACIHVEHPYENNSIIDYELHLRYFINMQRIAGLPYAMQTIGSAMAVRSLSYAKEGGMNLRQAGEDFYFLHKYSTNMTLGEIHNTTVYPSGRISDRVPFGTGKAVGDHLDQAKPFTTYNKIGFIELADWIKEVESSLIKSFDLPPPSFQPLKLYLNAVNYTSNWDRISKASSTPLGRIKAFYAWFDAFKLMKYLHFIRDKGIDDVDLHTAIDDLFEILEIEKSADPLSQLRKLDTSKDYYPQWRAAFISRLSNTTAS